MTFYENRLAIWAMAAFLLVPNGLAAEEDLAPETEVPPPPELPLQAPMLSAWRLVPANTSSSKEGNSRFLQSTFLRQQEGVRVQGFSGDQVFRETWYLPEGVIAQIRSNGDVSLRLPDVDDSEVMLLARGYFPELFWIREGHHQGVVEFDDESCHYYAGDVVEIRMEDAADDKSEMEMVAVEERTRRQAWISAETGLPMAIAMDGFVRVYDFQMLSSPIQLPGELVSAMERFREHRQTKARRYQPAQR